MLEVLIIWAAIEVALWMLIQWPFVELQISNAGTRIMIFLTVILWAWLLTWIIGVWVLLFKSEMRIFGAGILAVWYGRHYAHKYIKSRPAVFADSTRLMYHMLFLVEGVLMLLLLYSIYRGI